MFNPRELEGEVDHSFFDSDCDDGSIRKDRGKKVENRLEAEKGSLPMPDHVPARQSQSQTEAVVGDRSQRPEGAINLQNEGEKNHIREAEKAEHSYGSEVEDISRSSSILSIACMVDKIVKNGSDVKLLSIRSKSPCKSDLALSAQYHEEDDEDGYHQSQDESEEEEEVPASRKVPDLKGGKVSTPKKLVRRRHPRSPSPPSSESSSCAETESSCGSSDESCTLEPPASSRPKTSLPSSSPRMRRPRLGSAEATERPPTPTEESEDTVTDVTPLSTPEISPLKSLDLTQGSVLEEAENGRLPEQTQPESAPSSGLSNIPQEDESSEDVDKGSLGVESRLGSQLFFHCPRGRNRKNYSFTNDEVRRIDRENQRLLQELSRLSPKSRPGSTGGGKSNTANNPPPVRLYHSALNRQREQQRIERENLTFLKRLESIKPTAGMRRSEQLADYQRQARYLGTGSLPIYRSPANKEKASSITPSGKVFRPATAVHRSTRSASAAVDSTNTPVSRSNKASVPRPAWC